ncbi:MAG: hypothetical protein RMJ66_00435 [Bacteroidia bacterium]|nr:hypothetical protein [Bacteroidia bacterium]MDW8133511.1 hypothetical protein [Bacteroidia bacterium]
MSWNRIFSLLWEYERKRVLQNLALIIGAWVSVWLLACVLFQGLDLFEGTPPEPEEWTELALLFPIDI